MEFNKWYAAIDVHAGGQPLRIVTGGLPSIPGATLQERADYFAQHCGAIRGLLMAEPRGHHGMTGAIVTPPASGDARFGLLFMNNEGMADVSGHGVIAAVTALIETGQLPPETAAEGVRIDLPAGTIVAYADCEGSEVKSVSFDHIPCFAYALDVPVELNGLAFPVDVVYNGAFYAVVDVKALDLALLESTLPDLQIWGGAIKRFIDPRLSLLHPVTGRMAGIHGVVIAGTEGDLRPGSDCRNVTVFANEQFDRSPGGAGAIAHMAARMQRGEVRLGDTLTYEGLAGSQATVQAIETVKREDGKATVYRMTGSAFVIGLMNFVIDPSDPLSEGFVLR